VLPDLCICLNDTTIKQDVFVSQALQYDLLLGCDFLSMVGAEINIANLTLTYTRDDRSKGTVPILLTPSMVHIHPANTAMACSLVPAEPTRRERVDPGDQQALDLDLEQRTPGMYGHTSASSVSQVMDTGIGTMNVKPSEHSREPQLAFEVASKSKRLTELVTLFLFVFILSGWPEALTRFREGKYTAYVHHTTPYHLQFTDGTKVLPVELPYACAVPLPVPACVEQQPVDPLHVGPGPDNSRPVPMPLLTSPPPSMAAGEWELVNGGGTADASQHDLAFPRAAGASAQHSLRAGVAATHLQPLDSPAQTNSPAQTTERTSPAWLSKPSGTSAYDRAPERESAAAAPAWAPWPPSASAPLADCCDAEHLLQAAASEGPEDDLENLGENLHAAGQQAAAETVTRAQDDMPSVQERQIRLSGFEWFPVIWWLLCL
jgi:hypothetical protein